MLQPDRCIDYRPLGVGTCSGLVTNYFQGYNMTKFEVFGGRYCINKEVTNFRVVLFQGYGFRIFKIRVLVSNSSTSAHHWKCQISMFYSVKVLTMGPYWLDIATIIYLIRPCVGITSVYLVKNNSIYRCPEFRWRNPFQFLHNVWYDKSSKFMTARQHGRHLVDVLNTAISLELHRKHIWTNQRKCTIAGKK